ncbi:unnamed protein product [Rotaria sp. Silwood1]|nr:unnamed protein product [Rotaria sp. Silwood1]CAF0959601.1 unnamed protein product [Rotaria sp. Silwood1]CAF3347028.1 unnamed protein product [Rotaria sp. Silwood1]CAF3403722.1 unnamed protein product [Rotaria sp. Silwood1]CAF4499190.1 unnamed protein product [Rotaria sp. Silwood1]
MDITSCHSSLPIKNESVPCSSDSEDDQATAADVDANMDYCDARSFKQQNICRKNRNFTCGQLMSTKSKEVYSLKNQNQKFFETENDHVYQHLSNIDMMMVRDTMPLTTSQNSRHFSICILPHFDSDMMKSKNDHSKVLLHDRKYAFKKEILYH